MNIITVVIVVIVTGWKRIKKKKKGYYCSRYIRVRVCIGKKKKYNQINCGTHTSRGQPPTHAPHTAAVPLLIPRVYPADLFFFYILLSWIISNNVSIDRFFFTHTHNMITDDSGVPIICYYRVASSILLHNISLWNHSFSFVRVFR